MTTNTEWMAPYDIFRTAQDAARQELLIAITLGATARAVATALAVVDKPSLLGYDASFALVDALKAALPENSLAGLAFERFMRYC